MRFVTRYLAIVLFTLWSGPAVTAELPRIVVLVNYVASSGTVTVNGIPVNSFEADKDTSGGTSFEITEWLSNGSNQITLTVEPVSERGKATLKLQNVVSSEVLLTFVQEVAGEKPGSFDVTGLPEWAWVTATPVTAAPDGLTTAIGELHDAYVRSDIDKIIEICAPFFADQKKLDGLSTEMFSELITPMLKSGALGPLPETTVTSHADGRLFRVTGNDEDPPIRIDMGDDGIRMGEWWSMINGAWRVVR